MKEEGSCYAAGYVGLSTVTTHMNTSSKALTQLYLALLDDEQENILSSLISPTAHSNRVKERSLISKVLH